MNITRRPSGEKVTGPSLGVGLTSFLTGLGDREIRSHPEMKTSDNGTDHLEPNRRAGFSCRVEGIEKSWPQTTILELVSELLISSRLTTVGDLMVTQRQGKLTGPDPLLGNDRINRFQIRQSSIAAG